MVCEWAAGVCMILGSLVSPELAAGPWQACASSNRSPDHHDICQRPWSAVSLQG